MTPGITCELSNGRNMEKQIDRQIGCMTGFFQLFDRHHIVTANRLPSSPISESPLSSDRSDVSSASFAKAAPPSPSFPSPEGFPSSPKKHQSWKPSLPLPLPVFEVKEGVKSSWKLREAPRLSLDSLTILSNGGKQRRSPSPVARLMGLDALPADCIEVNPNRSELRRSVSESRVSRLNFEKQYPSSDELVRIPKTDRSKPDPHQNPSLFQSKYLRLGTVEGPSKDMETLTQIFEALQLPAITGAPPIVLMKAPLRRRSAPSHKILTRSPEIKAPICSPALLRRPGKIEGQRASQPEQWIPAVCSPKSSPRRRGSNQAVSPMQRIPLSKAEEEDAMRRVRSAERSRTGPSLLERCDKLLHSIAEIASPAEQPSPVSVLDSSFLSEDSSNDFNFNDPKGDENSCEYSYVADVTREIGLRGGSTDTFSTLERRRRRAASGGSSILRRLLVFDAVAEIIERRQNVAPWTAFACGDGSTMTVSEVWEEVRSLRRRDAAGNAVERDMAATAAGEREWMVPGAEMSAAVLHIERLLFKDLVADTIEELAHMAGGRRANMLRRRKLVF